MNDFFDEWSNEIKSFCNENNYDFDKAKKLSRCWGIKKCWGYNVLILQYHDDKKWNEKVVDETPMPVVLIIKQTDDGLVFEKTENTEKYLKIE